MNTNYITDEVRSLIGMESAPVEATHPVEASETRRFHQATMDEAPRHWDANWARQSRYGTLVAPPRVPGARVPPRGRHSRSARRHGRAGFRRPESAIAPEPAARQGPAGPSPQRRIRLRVLPVCPPGGADFPQDIYQRDGRSGPMVFILMEDTYTNESGDPLLKTTNNIILR